MPPNGEPFTEGDVWPPNPKNGDYHRLTYTQKGTDIPPRLYRYMSRKQQWFYISTDRRYQARKTKPLIQEFIDPKTSTVTDPKHEENLFTKIDKS
jgi:hypothetical protein